MNDGGDVALNGDRQDSLRATQLSDLLHGLFDEPGAAHREIASRLRAGCEFCGCGSIPRVAPFVQSQGVPSPRAGTFTYKMDFYIQKNAFECISLDLNRQRTTVGREQKALRFS